MKVKRNNLIFYSFILLLILIIFSITIYPLISDILYYESLHEKPVFNVNQTEFTDIEILKAVYSGYEYPERFGGYLLKNNNTIILNSVMFFCTNNITVAIDKIEEYILEYDVKGEIVESKEQKKFFEIETLEKGEGYYGKNGTYSNFYLVHKCSYLDQSDRKIHSQKYDEELNATLGHFNLKPITKENVDELTAWLWYLRNKDRGGSKVLSSFSEEFDGAIEQTIYETSVVYGDFGISDEVTLFKTTYSIDVNTGKIEILKERIKNFFSKPNANPLEDTYNIMISSLILAFVIFLIFVQKFGNKGK